MAKLPFALQLDSVREPLQVDLAGTLQRVKRAGYDHVEVSGCLGLGAPALAAALAGEGLIPISTHVRYEDCEQDLGAVLSECQALGLSHAAISSLSAPAIMGAEWVAFARAMAAFGEQFRDAGIVLSYQTERREFDAVDGRTAFETILETASPEALSIQLDVGWAQYAGADPVALLKACAGRVPTIHIQDIKARMEGEAPIPTELGNGATRFAPIFKAAKEVGVQWLIVEQVQSARDPLESARMNAAYMRVHVY